MEAIKISIDVNLRLSDEVKELVSAFLGGSQLKPKTTKQKAKAEEAPKAEAEEAPKVTITEVRKLMALKVSEHREDIKAKLEELGSPSVTKLDPSKYAEMAEFLNNL